MRVMGLDYGSKTVGVAVSDELMLTAQGIEIIRRERETKLRRTYARIEELVRDYKVDRIVLGFPRNMDNSEGERCRMVREFGSNVKRRTGLPVILWDERLTTVAAQRSMDETGVRETDRKKYVDEIAAMFILQGYMNSLAAPGHTAEII